MPKQSSSILGPLLSQIEFFLTGHEERFFMEQTQRLAKENNKVRIQKNLPPTTGFIFDGIAYVLPEHNHSAPGLHGLEVDLEYEMEALLNERKARNQEVRQISQVLFLICKDHTETLQDLRDLLPECVVPAFPELADLERTRPAAFSIQDNPLMLSRWEKALPRIEYYTATRILY